MGVYSVVLDDLKIMDSVAGYKSVVMQGLSFVAGRDTGPCPKELECLKQRYDQRTHTRVPEPHFRPQVRVDCYRRVL